MPFLINPATLSFRRDPRVDDVHVLSVRLAA
jgi:hypothetical protein